MLDIGRLEGKKADNADIYNRVKTGGVTFCSPVIMTSRPSIQATSSTTLAALADPPIRQIDGAAMDYLLIELVAILRESPAVAIARSKKIEKEMIPPPTPVPSSIKTDKVNFARNSVTLCLGSRSGSAAGRKSVVDEDEVRHRLEAIGMHVGEIFSDRSVPLLFPPSFIN